MTALVIRALVEDEARALFTSLSDPGLVGRPLLGRPYATHAEGGEYRPDWTWVALRDGVVVARAALWGAPGDDEPKVLDWFDFAPGEREAGVRLLRAMPHREYEIMLPPGWRDDPAVRAAAEERIDAAREAGYRPLVERFRYLWTPACGLPERPGRLVFRPEPDDEVILDVLRGVEQGSLDAHARALLDTDGVEAAARDELEFLHWMPSPRSWWRLACTPDGETVGLQIPGRNPNGPVVGFVGVVAGQRGHGYAYDLLVECTHQLVGEGAGEIAAATDLGNTPMAAHFARAGYPVVQHRYCMS
ncbi:GNAT family N-acetyltransferase [Streptomyces sp. RKND-216]|uniref:GNAT family N-acetyltransferase n=1 Tax=Streptomyces sp. RKND-216 TaxID=2562581 RepID=UPI00109E2839|nr:GNAT family N-acetyltransferase [Streptomyces sp. RKND-216]THA23891.1 GNAT family N-acetyltransferase [Streptomyces sp. RKND-216]